MPKVVDKYDKERLEVLHKIFNILGINENNNKFLLHELDNDKKKQEEILALEPEIKKYFICGKWNCFTDSTIKRKYLSFVKNVVKNMNYQIISTRRLIKEQKDTEYNVINKESIKINV